MKHDEIKDRYGNSLTVGTTVIYAEYSRNAALYIGKIYKITNKMLFIVSTNIYGERRVNKADVENQLISIDGIK